ncbi:hypothetical protein [Nocardioides sp. GXQ0305]|uniref:hypothetical protein n=1 Tax=Nocardioides sp. GXQ0305 TaxID=3423912 RepID=UPI003D7E0292
MSESKVPREWGSDAFAFHRQAAWHADALNPRFPLALRVAYLAMGTHRANGHAVFKQGEVAAVLGRVDEDGHHAPADRRTVYRAIRQAIDFGMLAEGSGALCLIVPRHRIAGGHGAPDAPCRRHPKPKATSKHLRAIS